MVRKGVFKITNKKTGRVYIAGSVANLDQLLYIYWRNLKAGKHHNKNLQTDFNKYGSSNFEKEIIIDDCNSEEEVIENRERLLNLYKYNTYNENIPISFTGRNPNAQGSYDSEKRNIILEELIGIIDKSPLNSYNKENLKNQINFGSITNKSELTIKINNYQSVQDLQDFNNGNKTKQNHQKALKLDEQSQYQETIKKYNKLIEQNPTEEDYYITKIISLIKLGCYDEAIECCNDLTKLDSKNQIINDKLNSLILLERYENALKVQPKKAAYYFGKAECLHNLIIYEEALNNYNQAIKLLPNNFRYYFAKAQCLYKLNHYNEALEYYTKAIKLTNVTDNWSISEEYYCRALCLEKLRRWKEAIISMKQSINATPHDFGTNYENKQQKLNKYKQLIKIMKELN